MPAPIVLVHDDVEFLAHTTGALIQAGFGAAAFEDPMACPGALEGAETVQLLITRISFALGRPNGVSLARVARLRRPGLDALFIGRLESEPHTVSEGAFLATPALIPDVVATVGRDSLS